MATTIKNSALAQQGIMDVINTTPHPLTADDIVKDVRVAPYCMYDTAIYGHLNYLRSTGQIMRVPNTGRGGSRYAYIKKGTQTVIPAPPEPVSIPVPKETPVLIKTTTKPEIRIENNHITIDHPQCRIVIELKGE